MKWKPLLAHVFPGEQIFSTQALSGGCINYCYKIVTNKDSYFVKFNNAARYPKMYECEAFSLNALSSTKAANVPNVLKHGDVEDMTFLVLEHIETKPASTKALEQLGHDLAQMHSVTQQKRRDAMPRVSTSENEIFGWQHDNYIGSLKQRNSWCNDWFEFYETQRILPLCNALVEEEVFTNRDVDQAKRYLDSMRERIPLEPSSLLHGDLWSGNFIVDKNDVPYLIDPASYYGHREIDIALTQLFGGFGNDFIKAYNETFPLTQGWQQRLPYFQLYPLLVHAVIFGGSYVNSVRNIIHSPPY